VLKHDMPTPTHEHAVLRLSVLFMIFSQYTGETKVLLVH
jgi:hypothetical protein